MVRMSSISLASSESPPMVPALLMTICASSAAFASAATESASVTSSAMGTARGSSLGLGARAVARILTAPRVSSSSTTALPIRVVRR
jgi:hypothetical protein